MQSMLELIFQLLIPVLLVGLGFFVGSWRERRHLAPQKFHASHSYSATAGTGSWREDAIMLTISVTAILSTKALTAE